jgi:hypothetical protein
MVPSSTPCSPCARSCEDLVSVVSVADVIGCGGVSAGPELAAVVTLALQLAAQWGQEPAVNGVLDVSTARAVLTGPAA